MIAMVVIVGVTMDERPNPTWPEQFLRDSIGFVQSLFYKPANAVAGFFQNINEMKVIYSENQRLKANLQSHSKLAAKIKQLEAENESLQEMLNYKSDLNDYSLRVAEVIMRSPDRWYQKVTINKGEKHGIKPNMAVITSDGLVGRVESISQFSSVIELLTDTNRLTNVSAIVQGNEEVFGIIEGYDVEKEAFYFKKIRIEAPLEIGQTVITSGLGGLYPKGLFIGEVIEVQPDQSGMTKTALVKPAADMYRLDHVFVVERSYVPQYDDQPQDRESNQEEDNE